MPELPPSEPAAMAARLVEVGGVRAVLLGGSRARGDHRPNSDTDLGLYYRPPLDIDALRVLARSVGGPGAAVSEPGAWGPWVDGGGWLSVGGAAVDWIYRDVDRVHRSWRSASAGAVGWHMQAGHPLGLPDFAYAGEVALGRVLADPSGELAALRAAASTYPPALGRALVSGLWEASFLIANARKGAERGDASYVSGCLFRALGLCAHAIHGRAGQWLINEKGAIAAAGRLPGAPVAFTERAQAMLAGPGLRPEELAHTLDDAQRLIDETAAGGRTPLA